MILATRCPQCGTSFRVVPDQIKLRGGWVRCGVCSTTFDGNASLIEVDLPPAPPAAPALPEVAEPAVPHHAPYVPDPIADHPAVVRMRGALASPPAPAPVFDADEGDAYGRFPTPREEQAPFFVDPAPVVSAGPGSPAEPPFPAEPVFRVEAEPVYGSEPRSEFLVDPLRADERPVHRLDDRPATRETRIEPGQDVRREPRQEASTAPHRDARRDPRIDAPDAAQEPVFASASVTSLPAGAREPRLMEPELVEPSFSASPGSSVPSFMRDEDETPPSPWCRVWLIAALIALVVLLAQAVMLFRTDIATRVPVLRPLLERICAGFECTVGYPRDLRQMAIESSSLETWDAPAAAPAQPAPADPAAATDTPPATAESGPLAGATGTDAAGEQAPGTNPGATSAPRRLALTVVLRNRARFAQPWPSFELSLTDFSETVVARRVLLPSAYLPPRQLSEPMPAGVERTLRIPIDTSDPKASGYRIAVFFP